jgi:hypothetical protein
VKDRSRRLAGGGHDGVARLCKCGGRWDREEKWFRVLKSRGVVTLYSIKVRG